MEFPTNPEFWSMVASIATVVGVVVVIPTAIIALRQLKEMTKARHLEAMLRVYEMIGSEAARKHRKFIYTELKSSPETLTAEEREHVEQISVAFDRIGILVASDLIPKEKLLSGHCEVIIRSWDKLEPYIKHHRKVVGNYHAKYFEALAVLAQEYHSRHSSGENLEIVNVWGNTNTPNKASRT
jgi:Domain of unknown function (DUF4760)